MEDVALTTANAIINAAAIQGKHYISYQTTPPRPSIHLMKVGYLRAVIVGTHVAVCVACVF